MKRTRSGGQRQRLARAEAEAAPAMVQSALTIYLLDRMAWGFLSPQEVQTLAAHAKTDTEASMTSPQPLADLTKLASAGSYGAHPNKCFASTRTTAAADVRLPKPTLIRVPFKAPVNEAVQAMHLPHELFAAIHDHYPDTWSRSILPDTQSLESFWDSVEGHPSLTHHITNKPDYKRYLIPLALHGDGVPLTGRGKAWQQGFTNFSFYSLVGLGSTSELLFYIWGLFDKLKHLEHEASSTLTRAFVLLRWSFQALFEGRWPSRDHMGNLLFGGFNITSL